MIVDSSKTGLENLIIAINAANYTALLSDTNASFGLPQVTGTPVGYRDTWVTVTPVENVDFVGAPVTFHYRRVSLDQNVVSPDLSYEVDDSTTLASLKAIVCASLNLIASDVEWVESTLERDPADQGGTGIVVPLLL